MTSKKLLVVDDEIGFAKFVEGVAEDLDFDVLLTDDPLEFGNLYSNDIDIVVLDLFMPNTDGIELLRFLSDNKSKASVILMSGKDAGVLHTAQELALEQGVKVLGVLQKPFRSEDLEKVLNKFEKVSAKNKGPLSDKCLFAVYRELMAGSIMLERPVKVSYLGPEGTFSYFAAKEKFGSSIEYLSLNGIDSVFKEVESERADYGIVPVENSTEGGIRETLNMFAKWIIC